MPRSLTWAGRRRAVLSVVTGVSLVCGTPAAASPEPSAAVAQIAVLERLSPGNVYRLPPFGIRNTGGERATYEVEALGLVEESARPAPAGWFRFSTSRVEVGPGETRPVRARIELPPDAEAGRYAALLDAHTIRSRAASGAAAARVTFSVERPNTRPWRWPLVAVVTALLVAARLRGRYGLVVTRRPRM